MPKPNPAARRRSGARLLPLLALPLLGLLAPAASAGGPELLLAGKSTLGRTLRFEVGLEAPSSSLFLLLDAAPGPVKAEGTVFGVGLSPALQLLPLDGSNGAVTVQATVPRDPGLDGATLYAEVVTLDPLEASGARTIALRSEPPLLEVDDFCYRLQGQDGADLDLSKIARTAYDLCIVDATRDGAAFFPPAEVAALRSAAEPERLRLAYLSIGEAEEYRWYWPHVDPALLASANPEWPGNHKVRYWEPAWKEVLIHGNEEIGASYLDRILDQGFDGVYLDVIDAFEFFGPAEAGGNDVRRDAAREMVTLVLEIAEHARFVRGRADFLIVPQNGANLLDPAFYPRDTLGPLDPPRAPAMADLQAERLLATVDAIGSEDTFFFGESAKNNPLHPQLDVIAWLELWLAAGRPVLATEYLTKSGKIDKLYDELAPAEGYVPFATVRELDELPIHPGHEPD